MGTNPKQQATKKVLVLVIVTAINEIVLSPVMGSSLLSLDELCFGHECVLLILQLLRNRSSAFTNTNTITITFFGFGHLLIGIWSLLGIWCLEPGAAV
jgi:hypothetical protein